MVILGRNMFYDLKLSNYERCVLIDGYFTLLLTIMLQPDA